MPMSQTSEVLPLFTMSVYDRVVPNDTTETLWAMAAGVLIVLTFDFAMRMLRGYLIDIAGNRSSPLVTAHPTRTHRPAAALKVLSTSDVENSGAAPTAR